MGVRLRLLNPDGVEREVVQSTTDAKLVFGTRDVAVSVGGTTAAKVMKVLTGPAGRPGPTIFVGWDVDAYSPRPDASSPVVFVGPENPHLMGLMLPGDSWLNTNAATPPDYVKGVVKMTVGLTPDPAPQVNDLWVDTN